MAADAPPDQRRPRRGSLTRPVSSRIYRAAWLAVAVPVLVAAFSVGQPEPLPAPKLPPSFDQTTAVQFATELATRFPDRSAGSTGAREAARWVAERLQDFGLTPRARVFEAEVPGLGRRTFVNLFALVPGDSPRTLVVMAHRDNLGRSPGANDNASGTGALLELARNVVIPSAEQTGALAHTLVFLSTDGGSYGGVGAADFAAHPETISRLVGPGASVLAVVNLDALAGPGPPRIELAGDSARSPAPALVATATASVRAQAGFGATRAGPFAQSIDLAFPFSLYEQGPLVARGISAVTLTTAGSRPPSAEGDSIAALQPDRLGVLGRSAQALLAALDEAADVARGTDSYVLLGSRVLHGWTLQLGLLAALIPFLAATVDLFARCRRRHIPLLPALRSLRSRLGLWAWAGGLFAFFAVTGILPSGPARPLALESEAARDWPVTALVVLLCLSAIGWLVARPRLVQVREVNVGDELGGHLAAMLALGIVALVVAATNPYALVFVLPSLHAWLWLPQVAGRGPQAKLGLYALGFAGPLLLLGSFAFRFDLGLDAIWYVLALVAVGYVPVTLALAFLAWCAVAQQVGALAFERYAPYPAVSDRSPRGPIRETIRQAVLLTRRARRRRRRPEPVEDLDEETL